jgi:Fe-S cluster biogenesis protein NfuA
MFGMFIQTEDTPNPDALKFLPGRTVMPGGTMDIRAAEYANVSPLAELLFGVDGVEGVFFAPEYIAVTKAAAVDWQSVKPHVQARIMDFYLSGEPLLRSEPEPANSNVSIEKLNDPVVQQILAVIDSHIKPGVARDGGDVRFVDFDQGVLYLEMRGACAGCPAAGRTLKSGIEKIMQAHVPDVLEVMAVN